MSAYFCKQNFWNSIDPINNSDEITGPDVRFSWLLCNKNSSKSRRYNTTGEIILTEITEAHMLVTVTTIFVTRFDRTKQTILENKEFSNLNLDLQKFLDVMGLVHQNFQSNIFTNLTKRKNKQHPR